jgi:hypothetical protein
MAIAGPAEQSLPNTAPIGERLQDIAWNMRERGFDDAICSAIEEEARLLQAMAKPAAASVPAAIPPQRSDPRLEALARLDRMPLAEKLALFA